MRKSTWGACDPLNRTEYHEWLNLHEFTSIGHVQILAT
jgi:hypothetical protein